MRQIGQYEGKQRHLDGYEEEEYPDQDPDRSL
jgi:hypothetical protein